MRDQELGCSQKRDLGTLRHLSFRWWCEVATHFLYQKNNNNKKIQLHIQNTSDVIDWIKKYNLVDSPYKALVLITIYAKKKKKIQNFGPSYILPKFKTKH